MQLCKTCRWVVPIICDILFNCEKWRQVYSFVFCLNTQYGWLPWHIEIYVQNKRLRLVDEANALNWQLGALLTFVLQVMEILFRCDRTHFLDPLRANSEPFLIVVEQNTLFLSLSHAGIHIWLQFVLELLLAEIDIGFQNSCLLCVEIAWNTLDGPRDKKLFKNLSVCW